jgi:peptidoglycan/LPS O-acetylase OafA/YrhL
MYFIWEDRLTVKRAIVLGACFFVAAYRAVLFAESMDRPLLGDFSSSTVVSVIAVCFIAVLLIALRKTGPLKMHSYQKLGALTYPLYLLHQEIGRNLFLRLSEANPHVVFWGVVSLMLFLAWIVSAHVERRWSGRLRSFVEGVLSKRRTVPGTVS